MLNKKLLKKKIAIIGLGYIGASLCVEFSKSLPSIGYDISKKRISELKNNIDKNLELSSLELKKFNQTKVNFFTNNPKNLKNCNIFIITVPTPVNKFNNPDITFLKNALVKISFYIKKNDIIIIESTVYPGLTEELCSSFLKKHTKLKYNVDFFCGYSPERVNPSDKLHTLKNVTKIVSGSTDKVTNIIKALYKLVSRKIYVASSIKVAESAKLIENCQRDINIALMNELLIIFNKLNIDIYEILNAAKTKWNFCNFYPGLVGGHCIGVDPYYLIYKSKKIGLNANFLKIARSINNRMINFIYNKILQFIHLNIIDIKKSKIIFLGATFKENCPDLRNSKSIELINKIYKLNKFITVCDPYLDVKNKTFNKKIKILNKVSNKLLLKYDLIIVCVPHKEFNKLKISKKFKIPVFEIRNITNFNYE